MIYYEIIWHVAAIIGGIKILCWILPWIHYKLFCCINLNHFKYGYVLITGASDGIGKALSKEFARRGFNLILISRSISKLESVRAEILSLHPDRRIELISSDFSYSHKDPANFYFELHAKIQNFDVSVLVNNVGVMDAHTLVNTSFENLENMISVNIYPSTFLTHKLIGGFIQRFKERKQRSLVINLSSTADESVSVGMSVYAATKRFNAFFSEGLKYENDGIEYVTVKPGPVSTPLYKNSGVDLVFEVDVDDYVRALLGGLRKGVNHGHWKHKILGTGIRIWPYLVNVGMLRMFMPIAAKRGLLR